MKSINIHALLKKNATFQHNKKLTALRQQLRDGQHPDAVVVCCSDSRVPPEVIFTLGNTLGVLFVVRNAGALVDEVGLESILYALEQLSTRLVVVLGHEGCGAVGAACDEGKNGYPELVGRIRKFFIQKHETPERAVKLTAMGTAAYIRLHLLTHRLTHIAVVSAIYYNDGKVRVIKEELEF